MMYFLYLYTFCTRAPFSCLTSCPQKTDALKLENAEQLVRTLLRVCVCVYFISALRVTPVSEFISPEGGSRATRTLPLKPEEDLRTLLYIFNEVFQLYFWPEFFLVKHICEEIKHHISP